jgi:hypothetical protein
LPPLVCSPWLLPACFGVCAALTRVSPLPAAAGASFEFTRCASANLREKDDHWNHAIGGFVAGATIGLRSKDSSFPCSGTRLKLTTGSPSQLDACPASSATAS